MRVRFRLCSCANFLTTGERKVARLSPSNFGRVIGPAPVGALFPPPDCIWARTSFLVMRPPGPVPRTAARLTLFSAAMRATNGDKGAVAPEWGGGRLGAAAGRGGT